MTCGYRISLNDKYYKIKFHFNVFVSVNNSEKLTFQIMTFLMLSVCARENVFLISYSNRYSLRCNYFVRYSYGFIWQVSDFVRNNYSRNIKNTLGVLETYVLHSVKA